MIMLLRSSIRQVWRRYDAAAESAPWITGFATCFVKGSAADIVAQRIEQRHHQQQNPGWQELSWRRNLGFALFSGGYTGLVQRVAYNIVYRRLFGSGTAFAVAAQKSIFDATVHVPLFYMPVGYYSNTCPTSLPRAGILGRPCVVTGSRRPSWAPTLVPSPCGCQRICSPSRPARSTCAFHGLRR